jgi:uncharacterized glyoxalase superfamily protein PhnB
MIMPILNVKDVDASIAFYEKLGFTKQMAMDGPDGVNAFAIITLGQANLALGRRPDDTRDRDVADFMVYLPEGGDLDGLYAAAKSRGIQIDEDIKTQYWGDRTFTVFDLDGYRITMSVTVHPVDMDYASAVMRGELQAE